jgi:hypothetical protein
MAISPSCLHSEDNADNANCNKFTFQREANWEAERYFSLFQWGSIETHVTSDFINIPTFPKIPNSSYCQFCQLCHYCQSTIRASGSVYFKEEVSKTFIMKSGFHSKWRILNPGYFGIRKGFLLIGLIHLVQVIYD